MKKYDVAVAGEIYVDHVFTGFARWPRPGEEVFTQEYVRELGGGAAITACALGQLGRSVSLVAVVGSSEMSWIAQRLSQFGIASTALRSSAKATGVTVSISSQEDRSFFTYVGANAELQKAAAAEIMLQQVSESRHLHLAFPVSAGLAAVLFSKARDANCTVSLDVGHQPHWLLDPANVATCSQVDYLLPNEREAELISGGDAHEYLRFTDLNQWPSGVIKMGAQGALMRGHNGTLHVPTQKVSVVDTTGAGDAFDAGFIDGLLDGETGEECLRRGCICGALSTQAAGALRGLPSRRDFARCYEEIYG